MYKIKKVLLKIKELYKNSTFVERWQARLNLGIHLQKNMKNKPKIGMAVLALNRPEYLEITLNSLFKSNLDAYDITILIQDGGSDIEEVKKIIEKDWGKKVKVERYYSPVRFYNAGAAINSAMKKLNEIGDFDIIGWADPDCLFHPDWLEMTMKTFLWAKANHSDHILGPITSFNSSDYEYHKILGTYKSPSGNYVVKRQAGMLNYFYFKEDFEELGFFEENPDDETLMTRKFVDLRIRNFCTETSYVEHIGQVSILNESRPVPASAHAIFPAKSDWGIDLKQFRKKGDEFYADIERRYIQESYRIYFHNKIALSQKILAAWSRMWEFAQEKWREMKAYDKRKAFWTKNLIELSEFSEVKVNLEHFPTTKSDIKVDIVMPVITRDLPVAGLAIQSIRENLLHPINKIYIVSPNKPELVEFAKQNDLIFMDENKVLPIKISDVDYVTFNGQNTMNRAGWIFQQLLKIGMHKHVEMDHYYILDSDTILTRPQRLEIGGKMISNLADEYNEPYFKTFEKLTGLTVDCPFSFTSHQMFVKVELMAEFLKYIEEHCNIEWYKAMILEADRTTHSGISDYDNFGQYMFSQHRDEIFIEYFYNIGIPRPFLPDYQVLKKKLKNKYKTISFQYYL
ncbi:MAG: DUF6492 family protein [Candidatus Dojkabacteria bacterium]